MHLLVRETHSLDAEAAADDLGQSPADIVLLSFSDSDLGAAAAAWEAMPASRPGLRLANLRRLLHPMSVDLYLEQVIASARCVVVRLLGGLGYWRYGAEEVSALCRARGIALALLPGDGRDDAALEALSTVVPEMRAVLAACLGQGGAENLRRALLLAAHLGGLRDDPGVEALVVPMAGEFRLGSGPRAIEVCAGCSTLTPALSRQRERETGGRAAILFYRSHLQAGDIAPVEALAAALRARGLEVRAFYVASLKEAASAAFVAGELGVWRPDVVLNATAFSAPIETAGAVVLQVVLAGSAQAGSARGLAGTDLAMHVVLPELDGRLLTGAISFKREGAEVPGLEFARTVHAPCACGIALAADRAAGWARLARSAAPVLGCVLSDYPGGGRVGHAVGLDTFASLDAILARRGVRVATAALCEGTAQATIDLVTYRRLFGALPAAVRAAVNDAWGAAEDDPAVVDGSFTHRFIRVGAGVAAVQPDRGVPNSGNESDRKAGYHDPDRPSRHGFVAFYLWLRHVVGIDAMLHVGAHGTLEWLPGKSVALSQACFPAVLTGGVPVIYPFIVNNPGEAAAAKRRLGAVTIGHMTPPLKSAGGHAGLEALLEEYAAADGMDRRRTGLLRREILGLAESTGLLGESGAAGLPEDDRLARLDAYLCDVKDAQIRDGLHVFGDAPGEWAGLDAALAGRFVAPGPAGAPSRGRADVLPTGRNLYSIDPRAVPTAAAMTLAGAAARELLRRHLQDQGEYPRRVVLNLWGSTTMRTGGEDLALALILLGVAPVRDEGSGRVTGFEVLPLALLDRPRVDVTLRVSGLFRDAFGGAMELFDAAVRAVAARDEAAEWNPLAGAGGVRVFGPAPGAYGAGVSAALDGEWADRKALGAAYLAASGTGYGQEGTGDFAAIAATADAFVQIADHRETDLLEGSEVAAHVGGFAALADGLGNAPALYHADTGVPEAPVMRSTAEEVVRMVRARAANPAWLAGMMRHGYRGGAEIARAVDGLHAFAATVPQRFDAQFELLFAATLGDAAVDRFLREANPAARAGMATRFEDARRRGLWHPRRNDVGTGS